MSAPSRRPEIRRRRTRAEKVLKLRKRLVAASASSDKDRLTAKLHRLERLRTEFIADEKTLQEITALYPSVDMQHLRSLRRAALKEQEQNKPLRSYRAIFQLLKELEAAASGETDSLDSTKPV